MDTSDKGDGGDEWGPIAIVIALAVGAAAVYQRLDKGNYPGPLGQVVIGRGGVPTMAWQSVARMGIPCLRRVEM